ncbi:ATP-dependent DNA helicase RRM3 [Frankliniella fusca]|uniref:ATP-dependent DNA helicase n=1 Tax=Frankliniella fusca TaxID=407009 RepID=A0AAE1GXL9_9NEOP|nr:ATP-dependent DNA helicase RRM3 [Frankliniella fusca]
MAFTTGSPHCHGIFWIKNAPDVSNIENESEEYLADVLNYFSNLVEAWNPIINPEQANTHPCRRNYSNVEDFEEDLAQLLHMVQRQVCSENYCQRVNRKTKKKECRFKFPREMQETSSMEKGDSEELEFRPRRNDPNLNKCNAFLIQLWRANMDIAPVISKRALLAYFSKYISKCEVQSKSLQEIFTTVIDMLDGDVGAKKAIHKVFMKSCAERDIGAQEVCHSLLRLNLHSAGGRQFVTVNLSEKKMENETFENETHGKCTLEKYKDRPNRLENISLWNFAKKYDMSKFQEVKRENIVRVFPKLKLNVQDQIANEDYYKQQVLLHVPWRDESQIKNENETWEEIFQVNELNDTITTLFKMGNKIVVEDEYESSENETSDEEDGDILEELLSSRLGPRSEIPSIDLGNRNVDTGYDWKSSFEKYQQYGSIVDFENYIQKMKKPEPQLEQNVNDFPNVQLSTDQQEIINVVTQEIVRIKTPHPTDNNIESTKRIIVQGTAGTGKSLIIKYLTTLMTKELGTGSFLLAAPTGVSAVLINGKTLHSVFKLPRKTRKFKSLAGEQARDLCNMMKDVKCLILDEFSMIGCNTLAMINRRCKEGTGCDEDFGGLIILLLGDIKQLPPVKDYSFYSKTQQSLLGKEGKALINNFQKTYKLTTCHRQAKDRGSQRGTFG